MKYRILFIMLSLLFVLPPVIGQVDAEDLDVGEVTYALGGDKAGSLLVDVEENKASITLSGISIAQATALITQSLKARQDHILDFAIIEYSPGRSGGYTISGTNDLENEQWLVHKSADMRRLARELLRHSIGWPDKLHDFDDYQSADSIEG